MNLVIKNKFKILFLLIIVVIICLAAYFMNNKYGLGFVAIKDNNKSTARELEMALQTYIFETKDVKLKFGSSSSKDNIEELFKALQRKYTLNGEDYGPYLNDSFNYSVYKKTGYSVRINQVKELVKVQISEKDEIIFE
ncbi:hypothetical protein [Pseudobacteroides cellulosolvens]|uniref:Uncharacterized protein n=1 Tax=Pseudobacteroides cellulosolvens ATCC 35603 = DSM 2933 TaxID=398512 RepID=A0A0L6JWG1_9FIRM|nr:hypothetical protein [Pseudobacteroides cellulosolvens]KNY30079.1 hypothetical protein Bccel_5356 [Pseudobacteroides cellulosolvens ATCC 35603 = DSM 2933]